MCSNCFHFDCFTFLTQFFGYWFVLLEYLITIQSVCNLDEFTHFVCGWKNENKVTNVICFQSFVDKLSEASESSRKNGKEVEQFRRKFKYCSWTVWELISRIAINTELWKVLRYILHTRCSHIYECKLVLNLWDIPCRHHWLKQYEVIDCILVKNVTCLVFSL